MPDILTCPQCGKAASGGLCAGVCPECLASSMLGEWEDPDHDQLPEPEEPIITRVADYDVLRVLGRGGMGVVCRARDRLLGREVALKLIHSGVLASDEELRRFRIEAEAVASLRHPNLIVIHEAGEADGQPYFTMTLADGGTLARRLSDKGPLEAPIAARLVQQIAEAVHHAHTRGVLHRDLKPANILFDHEGQPIVSDFGLARFTGADSVTKSGALLGTPAYLAPEVASGKASHTTSSDVYALGVILFESLTGRTPFENEAPLALLKAITEDEPPRPSSLVDGIDRDLEAVCLRALEKDPSRRYPSSEALATDLGRWLADEPVTARHPPITESVWRWAERHQTRAVLYFMAALTVIILIMLSAVMNVVMSTQQNRTAEAMHRSEASRARLLRDHAVQFLVTPATMLQALPHLDEAVTISTDHAIQDHAIRLRQRVVQRLAPQRVAHWACTQPSPVLAWSADSTTATCQDGALLHTATLSSSGRTSSDAPLAIPDIGISIRRSLHSPDGRSIILQARQNVSVYTKPEPLPKWSGTGLQKVWFDDNGRLILRTALGSHTLPPSSGFEPPQDAPVPEPSAAPITASIVEQTFVCIWRGKPGEAELCDPLPHSAPVTTTAIDPSARYIATLTSAGELRVWELATALPITPPLPVKPSLNRIAWDAAHYHLAVWSDTDCVLFNW